jgi:hypothetical protein
VLLESSDTEIIKASFTPFPVAPAFKSILHAMNRYSMGRSAMAVLNAAVRQWD